MPCLARWVAARLGVHIVGDGSVYGVWGCRHAVCGWGPPFEPCEPLPARQRRVHQQLRVRRASPRACLPACAQVKVTAYDSLSPSSPEPGTADAYVFPAGMYARGVPLEALPAVLVAVLQGEAPSTDAFEAEMVPGITLFVCCHAARDERCGHIGLPLAAKLAALAEAAGLGGSLRVLKTSHVGGHAVRWAALGRAALGPLLGADHRTSCARPPPALCWLRPGAGSAPSAARCFPLIASRASPCPPTLLHPHLSSFPCRPTLGAVRRQRAGVLPGTQHRRRLVWRGAPRQRRRVFRGAGCREGQCHVRWFLSRRGRAVRERHGCGRTVRGLQGDCCSAVCRQGERCSILCVGVGHPAASWAAVARAFPGRLKRRVCLSCMLAQAPSGAAGDAALRRWWRGRVGLSKPEQVAYHQAALKDIEDLQ